VAIAKELKAYDFAALQEVSCCFVADPQKGMGKFNARADVLFFYLLNTHPCLTFVMQEAIAMVSYIPYQKLILILNSLPQHIIDAKNTNQFKQRPAGLTAWINY